MRPRPLVIGHRGACGHRPEHTLASYALAIRLGADYVEPDLVATRDGVLVCRHENEISRTTDVASRPEFADRRTTKMVSGRLVNGWFTEDFTLAELKQLRAVERLPHLRPYSARHDGRYEVATFDEMLDLVEAEGRRRGVLVGVYPETKHPSHFASLGLDLTERLLAVLRRRHLDRSNALVYVQSFEIGNLRALRSVSSMPLVQLLHVTGGPYDRPDYSYSAMTAPPGLREIATYADAIGVHRDLATADLVEEAHQVGLGVHVWTVRDENEFLPADLRRGSDPAAPGAAELEYVRLDDLGVDGIFTDSPDTAVAALTKLSPSRLPEQPQRRRFAPRRRRLRVSVGGRARARRPAHPV